MVSRYEASELQRQVLLAKRIKTMNESVYYTVDVIHGGDCGESENRVSVFSVECEKGDGSAHGGPGIRSVPGGFPWDDENYYLVAYDAGEEKIKHYRVDKMRGLRMLEEPREGEEHFRQFDMGDMPGKILACSAAGVPVRLLMENGLAGVVIDRFGRMSLIPVDEGILR